MKVVGRIYLFCFSNGKIWVGYGHFFNVMSNGKGGKYECREGRYELARLKGVGGVGVGKGRDNAQVNPKGGVNHRDRRNEALICHSSPLRNLCL